MPAAPWPGGIGFSFGCTCLWRGRISGDSSDLRILPHTGNSNLMNLSVRGVRSCDTHRFCFPYQCNGKIEYNDFLRLGHGASISSVRIHHGVYLVLPWDSEAIMAMRREQQRQWWAYKLGCLTQNAGSNKQPIDRWSSSYRRRTKPTCILSG